MNTTWIVLANASRARIFESQDARKPNEVSSLVHPASRLKAVDLATDRPGHAVKDGPGGGPGGTAYPPPDPRRKEHVQFAREVAQAVHEAVASKRCDAVLLVASNPFLGELRSCLSETAARAVIECVPKDLTEIGTLDLQHRLADLLATYDQG